MNILVTGAAGFIGFHLVNALCARGQQVYGIDNLNDYYPVSLKYARLAEAGIAERLVVQGRAVASSKYPGYTFQRLDITDKAALDRLFSSRHFDVVVNLAAQAGVRYSIENPYAYIQSNIVGFLNILECCRCSEVGHLVYASSSSVYGGNVKTPFAESDQVNNQVSVYAATKRSDELLANVYSHLYGLRTTGLRFFTVYGPWGRPDMAPMLFGRAILRGETIKVFNNGDLSRDFTYIDDIVEGLLRVIEDVGARRRRALTPGDAALEEKDKTPEETAQARIYNIGHGSPMQLMDFIHELEKALGREAQMQFLPMQAGDVYTTYADTTALQRDYAYTPAVSLPDGIARFAAWFKQYT